MTFLEIGTATITQAETREIDEGATLERYPGIEFDLNELPWPANWPDGARVRVFVTLGGYSEQ